MDRIKTMLASGAAMSLAMMQNLATPQAYPRPERSSPRKKKVYVQPEPYQAVVHYEHRDPRQRLLNKMTNWQRNQYGRARTKNLNRDLSLEEMEKFTTLTKEQAHV